MVAQLQNSGDFLCYELIYLSWLFPPDTLDVVTDSQNKFQRFIGISMMGTT